MKGRVWVRVYIGPRTQTDALGRKKRKGLWKRGGSNPPRVWQGWNPGPRSRPRPWGQAQTRWEAGPLGQPSCWNYSRCLRCAQGCLRENQYVFRPDLLQPPTRRAGSIPQGGAVRQMHTFSLSDLHMEWRPLSPSPTLAPTPHVHRELPASPAPRTPSQGCRGLAAWGRGCMLRAGTAQRQGRLRHSRSTSFFWTLQGLSQMWQKQSQTRGLIIFAFTAQWSLLPPGILQGGNPQPVGERRRRRGGKKRRITTLLKDRTTLHLSHLHTRAGLRPGKALSMEKVRVALDLRLITNIILSHKRKFESVLKLK